MDHAGQLFIADDKAAVVRRVDTNGIIMTIAGTGTPGDGGEDTPANLTALNGPAGLALDARGNLFIAEGAGNRVRLVDPDRRLAPLPAPASPATGVIMASPVPRNSLRRPAWRSRTPERSGFAIPTESAS